MKLPKINAQFTTAGIVIIIFGTLVLLEAIREQNYIPGSGYPPNIYYTFLTYFAGLICIAIGSSFIALSFNGLRNRLKKILLKSNELSNLLKVAFFLSVLLLILYISFDALAWFSMGGLFWDSGYYPTYNFLINSFSIFPLSGAGTGTFFFQNTPLLFFIIASIVNIAFISNGIKKQEQEQ